MRMAVMALSMLPNEQVTSITGPEYEERHYVASADTMADVAVAAGIDSDGLVATLSTYNLDAAAGVDTVFGKDAAYMQQLTSPPFRVLPLVLGRSKSFGGCSAGVDGAVLDSGGTPIPGLYAAGEATGILGGPWIGWGFNGTITAVWWSGLRAGEAAAAAAGH